MTDFDDFNVDQQQNFSAFTSISDTCNQEINNQQSTSTGEEPNSVSSSKASSSLASQKSNGPLPLHREGKELTLFEKILLSFNCIS